VAVKILRYERWSSRLGVTRFLREAKAAARLRHPNIVRVHGIGRTESGSYFLVMDYVGGIDLEQRIRRGNLSVEEAAEIVATIAEAVDYVHEHGIIHRDLKPSNVLLEGGTTPLLTDFGLAKIVDAETPDLAQSGHILGSPCFLAPEQIRGNRGTIGPSTDVYGLGAILYNALTGKPPRFGKSLEEVVADVLSLKPPVPPRFFSEGVPPPLERICLRCLSPAPADRFASARDVARALRSWPRGGDGASPDREEATQSAAQAPLPNHYTPTSGASRRHAAYERLWNKLEDAHLEIRTGDVDRPRFDALLRGINAAMIRDSLELEKKDRLLVQKYLRALYSLKCHARRDAEAWRDFTITTLVSSDVAERAREVLEAERRFESLREKLITRIRRKLGLA
jgi:serine/threonine protein kinase